MDNGYHKHSSKKRDHTVIAEAIIGRELKKGECVHHWGQRADNTKLVICQDQAYHMLLHKRTRAYIACGNANARYCRFCNRWDVPGKNGMVVYGNEAGYRSCRNEARRLWRHITGRSVRSYPTRKAVLELSNG